MLKDIHETPPIAPNLLVREKLRKKIGKTKKKRKTEGNLSTDGENNVNEK